jgi:VWFA-related protein
MSPTKAIFILVLLHASAAFPQEADAPITRVTVNEVRIDAVVTDAKGHAVRNLQSDDFEVFQDGKRQKPIHMQYVDRLPSASPAPRSRELQASDVQRTMVILLDDSNMSLTSFVHSRRAMQQYLAAAMQPGDLVAILRTTQTSSYLNPFMSDAAAVRLAIDQMRYRPPAITPVAFRPIYWLLQSTITALGRMPGRKSLVILSDAMTIAPNSPQPFEVYRRWADTALRASVRIYGIDARGLSSTMPIEVTTDIQQTGVAPSGASRPTQTPSTASRNSSSNSSQSQSGDGRNYDAEEARAMAPIKEAMQPVDVNFPHKPTSPLLDIGPKLQDPNSRAPRAGDMDGLAYLARATGGLMLANDNNLANQFHKALDEERGYYLLSWNPGEKAFHPAQGSFADFHQIAVKMTHPGLTARSPQGFYGRDQGTQQADRTPRLAMQEALLAPFQGGRFNAQMNSVFDAENGRGYIRSDVFIDGKDIVFTKHPDSRRNDCYSLNLELLTLPQPIDAGVETLAESQFTRLEMCGTSYEAIAHDGLAVTMLHPVASAGAYEMRLAVRNAGEQNAIHSLAPAPRLLEREEGEQPVGSVHQLVIVPDWRSTPSVFGLRVQSTKVPDSVARPKLPGETDKNMTLAYRPASAGDPSVRTFSPGDALQYLAKIANISEAAAEIHLTRTDGETMTEIYTGKVDAIHDGDVSGRYTIDDAAPPGNYDLHLVVTGKDASGQPYTGSADMDFDLRK